VVELAQAVRDERQPWCAGPPGVQQVLDACRSAGHCQRGPDVVPVAGLERHDERVRVEAGARRARAGADSAQQGIDLGAQLRLRLLEGGSHGIGIQTAIQLVGPDSIAVDRRQDHRCAMPADLHLLAFEAQLPGQPHDLRTAEPEELGAAHRTAQRGSAATRCTSSLSGTHHAGVCCSERCRPPSTSVLFGEHGRDGLLVDFFDVDGLAQQVIEVLARPDEFAHLGPQARARVVEHHDLATRCLPALCDLVLGGASPSTPLIRRPLTQRRIDAPGPLC
jgi:hypothetical protein